MDFEVVLDLTTNAGSLDTLDRFGDMETLTRLDDRLSAIDGTTELVRRETWTGSSRRGRALGAGRTHAQIRRYLPSR